MALDEKEAKCMWTCVDLLKWLPLDEKYRP